MAHFRPTRSTARRSLRPVRAHGAKRRRSGPTPSRESRDPRKKETKQERRRKRTASNETGSGDAAGSGFSINTAAKALAQARHTAGRRPLVAAFNVAVLAQTISGPYGIRLGQAAPRKTHLISRQTVNKPSRHRRSLAQDDGSPPRRVLPRGTAAGQPPSRPRRRCGRFCNRFRRHCDRNCTPRTAGKARFSALLLFSARELRVERRRVAALFVSARRQNVGGAQAKATWRRGSLGPTRSRRPSEGVSRAREKEKKSK